MCVIIMFSVASRLTYKSVPNWYHSLMNAKAVPNTHVTLCGNMVDVPCEQRLVKPKNVWFHRRRNLQYYDISANGNFQLLRPLQYLARRVFRDPYLELAAVPLLPAVVPIDEALQARYQQELTMFYLDLPDMDDDDI
eukprot:TRINITY_DN84_c4_g1_i3.p2 TRINITY_DN84_c4_g1~~TRINITY_DN84_c4_g1_i3.p2  ORF type:complete len:137 (-),score=39.04 TRINITY_DN84_c4_g1_i3:154-564(-)